MISSIKLHVYPFFVFIITIFVFFLRKNMNMADISGNFIFIKLLWIVGMIEIINYHRIQMH